MSPSGARAVFAARGEIVTVPAEKGDPRNLTNTPGVMEREPQWSPDGKSIAYLSDESGEYALHMRPQSGEGEVKKIELKPGFYRSPRFSPDSKKIALVDSFPRLWYVDLDTTKQVEVDHDTYQMRTGDIAGAWSPDSKWLAYSKVLPNELSAIHLYSLADGKSTQVTDGMSDATNPVFDRDGKYLYFTASTNSGESLGLDIHAVGAHVHQFDLPGRAGQDAALSVRAGERRGESGGRQEAPRKPKPDAPKPKRRPGATPPDGAAGRRQYQAPDVKIDLEGIDQRISPSPCRRAATRPCRWAKRERCWRWKRRRGGWPAGPPGMIVHRYDLKARKSDVPLSGVSNFTDVVLGGEKALYRQGENWMIAALRPMATGAGGGAAPPPRAGRRPGRAQNVRASKCGSIRSQEWTQMYREAWRVERDWFYDRNLHGLEH